MYGWKFATRCRLFLLTLATMASYMRTIANKFILFLIMSQGRTLYVGSSHLVPLEMVNDPPRYGPAWETRRRRRVRQCDLPPGPMDVFGGRTISETVPVYREKTRDHATWKTHHPDLIHRAVILLGGNDLVNLTEERLANPNTPRRHCHTLITNPIILRQQAIIIARLIQSLRGLLLQYVPRVFTCTLIPRDVAINYDHPITIINDHLRDSLKSKHVIPLHLHLHKCHLCQDGIHLNHHGCEILTTMLCTITQWSSPSSMYMALFRANTITRDNH